MVGVSGISMNSAQSQGRDRGRVVRFDQVKGYGFITPDSGGDDLFLHVNDLAEEKFLYRPGAVVEFLTEFGERGPKASAVSLITPAGTEPQPTAAKAPAPERNTTGEEDDEDDDFLDLIARGTYLREVTEALLKVEPVLDSKQVLAVRTAVAEIADRYGWLVD